MQFQVDTAAGISELPCLPFERPWSMQTVLLMLMIDFKKIATDGRIRKDDLIACSLSSAEQKDRYAMRLAADCFEEMQHLIEAFPRPVTADSPRTGSQDKTDKSGILLSDLLHALAYVCEHTD